MKSSLLRNFGKLKEEIKIMLSIGFFLFLILSIVLSVINRKSEEEKITKNPCYTKCTNIEVITGNKGIKSFKYTFEVDGIPYTGHSAAGDETYRENALKLTLYVRYVCDEPKISRLMLP